MRRSNKNIPELPDIGRSASQPLKKGKIMKGMNYDNDKLVQFTKHRLDEMEEKLDQLKKEQRRTQTQLEFVKAQVKEHIEEERCGDPVLEKCLTDFDV